MKHTLAGQLDIPDMPEEWKGVLRDLAKAPLLTTKEQKPCDIGLFSDEANQLDLIEMLQAPHE